jgi:hypothetical protein
MKRENKTERELLLEVALEVMTQEKDYFAARAIERMDALSHTRAALEQSLLELSTLTAELSTLRQERDALKDSLEFEQSEVAHWKKEATSESAPLTRSKFIAAWDRTIDRVPELSRKASVGACDELAEHLGLKPDNNIESDDHCLIEKTRLAALTTERDDLAGKVVDSKRLEFLLNGILAHGAEWISNVDWSVDDNEDHVFDRAAIDKLMTVYCERCGGTGLYASFGANLGAQFDTDCEKCATLRGGKTEVGE